MLMINMKLSVAHKNNNQRLYNPETGERLNDKTMKSIEDARKGKGIAFSGNINDFIKWAKEV